MGIQMFPPTDRTNKILSILTAYQQQAVVVSPPPPSSNWATLIDIVGSAGLCTIGGVTFSIRGSGTGHIELRVTIDDKQQTIVGSPRNMSGGASSESLYLVYIENSIYYYGLLPIVWTKRFKIEYRTIVDSGTFAFYQAASDIAAVKLYPALF